MTYATLAGRARRFVKNDRVIRIVNRAGGAMLIGAGVATVAIRSGT